MNIAKKNIDQLALKSKEVILDCCLPSGAIVAANSKADYFPKEAKNYYFIWPRDGAFICLALDVLGIKDIQERFFNWIKKAEGWQETGLFFANYNIDGSKNRYRFQPDQTGLIIFTVINYLKKNPKNIGKYKNLVIKSAKGICDAWDKDHFNITTNDLWEERNTDPDLKDNFLYSLGVCIAGLLAANELFPNALFKETAFGMKKALMKSAERKGYFYRSAGNKNDDRIDASVNYRIIPRQPRR